MNYLIKHTRVGPFKKDRVVSDETLTKKKANLEHLLNAGAIEETELEESSEPVPYSPTNPAPESSDEIVEDQEVEEDQENQEDQEAEEEEEEEVDWASMDKKDLFKEANNRQLKPAPNATKAQLVALITGQ